MTTPNIVGPCVAIELPPLALDVLITCLVDRMDELAHVDPERDVKMEQTLLDLLVEVRKDFRRRLSTGEIL